MKLIMKILAAPIIAALSVTVWFCAFLLQCSAFVLGIASVLLTILSAILFISGASKNGAIILAAAFLCCPYGLPMLAAWTLGLMQRLRYAIQNRVYG